MDLEGFCWQLATKTALLSPQDLARHTRHPAAAARLAQRFLQYKLVGPPTCESASVGFIHFVEGYVYYAYTEMMTVSRGECPSCAQILRSLHATCLEPRSICHQIRWLSVVDKACCEEIHSN